MRQISETRPSSYKIVESDYCNRVTFYENITPLDADLYAYDMYITNVPKDADLEDSERYNFYLELAKLEESQTTTSQTIAELKSILDSSDYQIIKCIESYMLGAVLPYDFSQLLSERNRIRDKIDMLENNQNLTEDEVIVMVVEETKNRKIIEMSAVCQTTITNGIDYQGEHYRLNTTDQINLTSLYTLAQAGQIVPYHADGVVCRMYEPAEMIGLVQASIQWITYHTTYFNLLKHQILEMTTLDEVNAVVYGMTLKDEYQAIINIITGQ